MNQYTYTDNTTGKVICSGAAESITEADKKFEQLTGTHPSKLPMVGCTWEPFSAHLMRLWL